MPDRMRAACEIVAREASRLASGWSEQIPPSMRIHASQDVGIILSATGPSYPNEIPGVRHPVFGNRREWVTNEYRPFLAPAAVSELGAVAEEIGMEIDDLCHSLGYTGSG